MTWESGKGTKEHQIRSLNLWGFVCHVRSRTRVNKVHKGPVEVQGQLNDSNDGQRRPRASSCLSVYVCELLNERMEKSGMLW